MLTDLLTDFCVSTSMTSPPVTGLATGGVDDAGSSVVLEELELEVVVVVVVLLLLLLLEMVLVAGSVGSSVVGENTILDS